MSFKRLFSLLLVICLIFGVLPTVSLATDTSALHNCNVPEGYHLFTSLPTAEDPVTTETLYMGNAFDGVFYGMNGTFSSGSTTTSADVAAQSTLTIHYGGNDETYGDYYYLVFTQASGTAYAFAYASGVFSQNKIQDTGLPSGGWAAKHKMFYDAEEQLFYHRPSADMTVMKSLKISASSFKFFSDTVAKVLAADAYPVRMYEPCTSDNVAGSDSTHTWRGTCACGYKFDYKEKTVSIVNPTGYHLFTALPTADAPVTTQTLYMGNAFDDVFYGMNSAFSSGSTTTSADVAAQSTFTVHYGGNDETYGDYYYLVFTQADGTAYAFAYASGVFSQNKIQDTGLPSGGWAAKHKMFYDAKQHIFYHRPSADMTVMKALKISATSFKTFTNTVEDVLSDGNYPVRMYESCTSDNVAGKNDTHHWSGICTCGYKFDYEVNYVLETRAPQANNAYFWGVTQLDMEGDPTYFFNGEKLTSTFNTQADMLSGTPVYVDVVEGGYNLYFLNENSEKQYICLGKDASNSYSTYIAFETDAANATVFTWNEEYSTFVTVVVKDADGNTVDMVLGAYTSGTTAYTKISALTLGHLAQAHYFPAQLYVEHLAHAYSSWDYDTENHWKACFCGGKQDAQAHTLGDAVIEDGKIYQKCICGYAEECGTVPSVYGKSITLKDNIAINFYVESAQFGDGIYKDPYMIFVMNGEGTKVTEYKVEGDYYIFTFDDLTPDMMNETVTANLYVGSEQGEALTSTSTYSVAQYCYAALAMEETSDALRTLLVETLNLGAVSQQYRNSDIAAEDLVNANLTEQQRAWGYTGELRALESCRDFGNNRGEVRWYGVSALMGDRVQMRVYFTAEDVTDLTVQAESVSGQWSLQDIQAKDGMYHVDFNHLNPAQMDEKVSFTVYRGETALSSTMHYSIESYAAVWVNKTDARPEQVELVKAIIRYGDAAKAYVERVYGLQQDGRYIGRTYETGGTQWFNWSASGFSVRFQGSGLKANIASNAPDATNYAYLKVYVDGVEQTDILLNKKMQTVVLAEGLNPDEIHTVEVRKRNSPRSSTAGLLSMEVLDGNKVAPEAAKGKLIEFVGDSLTVGYSAADGNKTETTWSTKTEDATKTYSKQVADAFDAEYMVTAISGRGVVMNNGGASGYLFPEIYPELDIYNMPGTAYDFALQPDVIVINLGTNDATNSNLDVDAFRAGVYSFIKTVREKNPNAQIIWAYGLRSDKMTAQVAAAIEAAVTQVNNEGDNQVHYLPLAVATDMHLNHPTEAAYAPSGEKIIEKIEEITGW